MSSSPAVLESTGGKLALAIVEAGRRVLRTEAAALAALEGRLDASFVDAVQTILLCDGRVVVSGIGKSGIIGRKLAATLTSTGTPAMFLHPVEALHGDLGIVGPGDIAILLSKSGESDELLRLVEFIGRTGVHTIVITGCPDSTLGRLADVVLECAVAEEACPHDLAPTSSTTAAMALGDALAVSLLLQRGFGPVDFARVHPAGALGRRLLLRVRDVMVPGRDATLSEEATMRDCVLLLARSRGLVAVVDAPGFLKGVVTAGDLTRLLEKEDEFFSTPVVSVMNHSPQTAEPDQLGAAAIGLMERKGIMAMPVLGSEGRVAGVVHLHDLMRAGAA